MTTIAGWRWLCGLWLLLVPYATFPEPSSPTVSVGHYQLVGVNKVGPKHYQLAYRATVTNRGSTPFVNLVMKLTLKPDRDVSAIKDTLTFGKVAAHESVESKNNFILEFATEKDEQRDERRDEREGDTERLHQLLTWSILSTGPTPTRITIPNVVGLPQASAATALAGAGLVVGTVTRGVSSTVVLGSVISQSPAAGTLVDSGSGVNLVISAGSPAARIAAPSSVAAYSTVLLDGTLSRDPTAAITSYLWQQTAGPPVTLTGANTTQASFTAPQVTAQTLFSFLLTITDSTAATSSASANVNVSPATSQELVPRFVAVRFLQPAPPNGHSDYGIADGPPLAGSAAMIEATLTGALQSPAFSVVDVTGNVLSTPSLALAGSPSLQPLDYVGTINVPAIPFRVAARGTTADGQLYSLQSPTLLLPMNMAVMFGPPRLLLARGASAMAQMTIYNAGGAATFTAHFTDPQRLLAASQDLSIPIGQAQSVSVPLTFTYPTTLHGVLGPSVSVLVFVANDATRIGTATLTVFLDGAP